jgi:hypothetical protein
MVEGLVLVAVVLLYLLQRFIARRRYIPRAIAAVKVHTCCLPACGAANGE